MSHVVRAIRSELEGIALTSEWLYGEEGDSLYLDERDLPEIIASNKKHANSGRTVIGAKLSRFEMHRLLLETIGQATDLGTSGEKTQSLLLRDLHDLYKYGLLPAHIEDNMQAAGLLQVTSV